MSLQQQRISDWIAIGERRIVNILRKHGIATMRMLEQKISDAGPNPQRVNPHILTKSRTSLANKGILQTRLSGTNQWHFLVESDSDFVDQRFSELSALQARTENRSFTDRMGDAAEIAVLKAMQRSRKLFVGHFTDLDKHDDGSRYLKHDPDFFSGVPIEGGKLDYILIDPAAGGMGIEIKNTREWVYPEKDIVTQFLRKCLQIDVVPILIARRIHYTTFAVLNACGGIVHQVYNQLYPYADLALAELVRNKLSLGYSDVRVGNEPDSRLLGFFQNSLPKIAAQSRKTFDQNKQLIDDYVNGAMPYTQFQRLLRPDFDPDSIDY